MNPTTTTTVRSRGPWALAFERLRHDRAAIAAGATLVGVLLLAVLAPVIARLVGHGPGDQFLDVGLSSSGIPIGPNRTFLLGTDSLGRDVLVRIAYGTRVSLLVGVLASALAVLVGTVVGIAAGWYGGLVDRALSRLMDVVLSLPFLVFALALVAVVGPSLTISVTVIAFFTWASVGRVVRAQALSIRELEYVQAARTLGASHARIMFVEILPNVTASVIVYTTLLIPGAITGEATLSFLGLSVVPPTPSWGNMLADAMAYYKVAWWFVFFPGAALLITTVAFNVLGDSVRDALDPRRDTASRGSQQEAGMIRFLLRRARVERARGLGGRHQRVRHLLRRAARRGAAHRRPSGERADDPDRARAPGPRPARAASSTLSFLRRLAGGDLGESFLTQEPVTAIVARDFPVTASLALGSAVLWLVMGVGAGVIAATRRRSTADHAITGIALAFYSMPTFLLGQLLLFFLFFQLYLAGFEFFPPGSYVAFSDSPLAVGAVPHPAVAVDCARHSRHLLSPHAERDDRRARRGLHPDRTRQRASPSGGSHIGMRFAARSRRW